MPTDFAPYSTSHSYTSKFHSHPQPRSTGPVTAAVGGPSFEDHLPEQTCSSRGCSNVISTNEGLFNTCAECRAKAATRHGDNHAGLFPTSSSPGNHWTAATLDPRLYNPSSSALAGALEHRTSNTQMASANTSRPTSITPSQSYINPPLDHNSVGSTTPVPEASTSASAGPTLVPSASTVAPKFCSVKGCKGIIPGDHPYKMCDSCRVKYKGYGITKRAKWKREREQADAELERRRAEEDQRRVAQGLPPLAEATEEEWSAFEQSIDQYVPSQDDLQAGATRMCTVNHCHKILSALYPYKRCEQHRIQNRHHSNLKRVREKAAKANGPNGEEVRNALVNGELDIHTEEKEKDEDANASVNTSADAQQAQADVVPDASPASSNDQGQESFYSTWQLSEGSDKTRPTGDGTLVQNPSAKGVRRKNWVCSIRACYNLLPLDSPWKMCEGCRARDRLLRRRGASEKGKYSKRHPVAGKPAEKESDDEEEENDDHEEMNLNGGSLAIDPALESASQPVASSSASAPATPATDNPNTKDAKSSQSASASKKPKKKKDKNKRQAPGEPESSTASASATSSAYPPWMQNYPPPWFMPPGFNMPNFNQPGSADKNAQVQMPPYPWPPYPYPPYPPQQSGQTSSQQQQQPPPPPFWPPYPYYPGMYPPPPPGSASASGATAAGVPNGYPPVPWGWPPPPPLQPQTQAGDSAPPKKKAKKNPTKEKVNEENTNAAPSSGGYQRLQFATMTTPEAPPLRSDTTRTYNRAVVQDVEAWRREHPSTNGGTSTAPAVTSGASTAPTITSLSPSASGPGIQISKSHVAPTVTPNVGGGINPVWRSRPSQPFPTNSPPTRFAHLPPYMWPRPVTPQDMAAAVAATTTAATGVSLTAMNNAANTHEGEVALAVPDAVARALGQVLVAAGQQAASAQKEGSEGDDSDEEVMDLTRDEETTYGGQCPSCHEPQPSDAFCQRCRKKIKKRVAKTKKKHNLVPKEKITRHS